MVSLSDLTCFVLSCPFLTAVVYVLMAIVCGSCVLRVVDGSTMYGLLYNYNVVALVSAWSPLVLAGMRAHHLASCIRTAYVVWWRFRPQAAGT